MFASNIVARTLITARFPPSSHGLSGNLIQDIAAFDASGKLSHEVEHTP
jgi:hypothetical protein